MFRLQGQGQVLRLWPPSRQLFEGGKGTSSRKQVRPTIHHEDPETRHASPRGPLELSPGNFRATEPRGTHVKRNSALDHRSGAFAPRVLESSKPASEILGNDATTAVTFFPLARASAIASDSMTAGSALCSGFTQSAIACYPESAEHPFPQYCLTKQEVPRQRGLPSSW
jgi:hypothetical protein